MKSTDNNAYLIDENLAQMQTIFRHLLILLTLLITSATTSAATDSIATLRPVTAAYMLEIGSSHISDTYLTPLKYTGWTTAFSYERMQAMKFNPERWVMRLATTIEMDKADNPVKNSSIWYLGLDVSWGMTHRWKLAHDITLAAGGSTAVDLGCIYSERNGNNPASAKAAWTLNLTAYASWNLNIGSLPVTLRYQPTLPVTGVFFSPDYGQLYYEIYLGNDSGLAHAAWWGNYFAMENLLTADLHLSSTCLRIGYRNNILSTKVDNITTRMANHSFVVGLSGEWIGISSRKSLPDKARIISALY